MSTESFAAYKAYVIHCSTCERCADEKAKLGTPAGLCDTATKLRDAWLKIEDEDKKKRP